MNGICFFMRYACVPCLRACFCKLPLKILFIVLHLQYIYIFYSTKPGKYVCVCILLWNYVLYMGFGTLCSYQLRHLPGSTSLIYYFFFRLASSSSFFFLLFFFNFQTIKILIGTSRRFFGILIPVSSMKYSKN